MQLTKEEFDLIEKAEKSLRGTRTSHVMLLIVLIGSFVAMFFGVLDARTFAYMSVGSVYIAVYFNFGGANYQQIVKLLVRVRSETKAPTHDPLIQSLSKSI